MAGVSSLLDDYHREMARLRALSAPQRRDPSSAARPVGLAQRLAGKGRSDLAAALLLPLAEAGNAEPAMWLCYGLALRDRQKMEEARRALEQCRRLDPDNARALAGLAQVTFETGRPAAGLFRLLKAMAPGDAGYTLNLAYVLAAEGALEEAKGSLGDLLARRPDLYRGHEAWAGICSSAGDREGMTASYERACEARPQDAGLWIGWIQLLIAVADWEEARRVAGLATGHLGDMALLTATRASLASETGALDEADALFEAVAGLRDARVDITRVRHALRRGRLAEGERIASRHLSTTAANQFWPYMSVFWRLRDAPEAAWLDGDPAYVSVYDLDYTREELDDLARVLRQLHTTAAPFPGLSVRGGTQTDRPLFFRNEPALQLAREKVAEAVSRHVAALPPHDPRHPLLSSPRGGEVLFEGSWSVRLTGQGYHTRHTHPRGWISSVFYVALPETGQMGAAPAGWLSIGDPPPELGLKEQGLDLPAARQVDPKPGRLVLFPSTMWHGTEPFDDGERLTIAFDVKYPPAEE